MIIFVVALAVIILLTLRITTGFGVIRKNASTKEQQRTELHDLFLSHRYTTVINGIFVLLIFFSHSTGYLTLSNNILDTLYRHFQNFHNQWVVTTFLAFSGYGVMLKIMRGGGVQYLRTYPRNRLLKTLFNFDISVLIYLVVNTLLGIHYDIGTILLSFIGYESVGNSNWYIFTILLMYLVSYVTGIMVVRGDDRGGDAVDDGAGDVHGLNKKQGSLIATIVTVCAVAYVVIAQITGLPSRFVSTVVTYALGMWIAVYKDEIESLFKKKPIITLIAICIPILATYKLRGGDYIMNINSCFFVLLVVWFMAHFEIKSKILYFLGKHAFSIYILQRIPMIIISHFYSPSGVMNYVFVAVSLGITIAIAVLFDKFLPVIDRKIIRG